MKIVVTGSLGHISKPLTETLIARGHDVNIISSHSERVTAISALGATPAIGSIHDVDFLAKTFVNADAVYCMMPPDFTVPDQVAYYAHTAECYAAGLRHSNVKRVVYLSSYGAHLPAGTGFISGSHQAENILNEVPGISITHIRPTFFYYNLFSMIRMIKSAGFIGNVFGGKDKLAMVAPQDIAIAVAQALSQTTNADKIVYVASDDRTCNEVAQVLGNAIAIPSLQWKVLPEETVKTTLIANGMTENAAANLVEIAVSTHNGVLREEFDKANVEYGNTKLEEFAKDFAAKYNQLN
jgi:uncharacterized protein YbjT (DUF2867 family)